MIRAKINGISLRVPEGATILEAAEKVQIKIPVLCKHPDLPPTAACGICIVKLKGMNKMLRACCTPIEEGMEIITHDPEIVEVRRSVIELILSKHPNECLSCGRNRNCELQKLAGDFGINEQSFPQYLADIPADNSTKSLVLEPRKCISCGRCVHVCQQMQNVWALSFLERGFDTRISPAGDIQLADSPCVKCGQCSAHCPTGAIFEYDETGKVWELLQDENKYCIVQIAPAVRVAVGEWFGFKSGANTTRKLYAALRRMGFRAVFDTNFGADLTIVEEAHEFVHRFTKEPTKLPLITSCCPAWVDFMEKFYPDMVDHFSSCKSPHQMVGALSKTYYAQKQRLDPSKIVVVSIMPCTAKKHEISRDREMFASGHQDVDISLTTRELARMIKQAGIDFPNLPEEDADHMLGEYSGAGTIFGMTGGVMEAALRTAYDYVTGGKLKNVDFENVRGLQGVKEGTIPVGSHEVKVAVAHGLSNVEYVLNKVREAKKNDRVPPYHFIEVMACPGGCVGGGGQPYGVTDAVRNQRGDGLYEDDREHKIRYSHENPFVKKLYKEFLGEPRSEKVHHLLHTTYRPMPEYKR
ncbi:MAG: NADH-dependent [FeFe] hydrogenase, group A6 [Verrucomicrobiae bacterium]|nr:NADH-dependent [FeFe] hydrogenase, group A6 [Verrucomicrobiae bacterium]